MQTRQVPGEPRRLWHTDDYFDLYVWFTPDGAIAGFQLCYDKYGDQRALTWLASGTFRHERVDAGDENPYDTRTPVLCDACPLDAEALRREFVERAEDLDASLRDLILEHLR